MHKLMDREKLNGYYVYMLLDPSTSPVTYNGAVFPHEPFYLGKGKNTRIYDHVREARNNKKNSHKVNRIRKIIDAGLEVVYFVVADGLSSECALKIEGEWGDIIGYRFDGTGILTNLMKTGIVNPILYGTRNGFFKKQHSIATKKKIADSYMSWFLELSDEKKKEINDKRSATLKGRVFSKEQRLKMLKTKYGPTYTKIGQLAEEAEAKREAKRIARQEKRQQKMEIRKTIESKKLDGTYWQEIKGGSKNPMFGQGNLLVGHKNGKAKMRLITILGNDFLVHGNFKAFIRDLKKTLGCKNPFSSKKSAMILKPNIVQIDKRPKNGTFIEYNGEESLIFLWEIYATTCNQKY